MRTLSGDAVASAGAGGGANLDVGGATIPKEHKPTQNLACKRPSRANCAIKVDLVEDAEHPIKVSDNREGQFPVDITYVIIYSQLIVFFAFIDTVVLSKLVFS